MKPLLESPTMFKEYLSNNSDYNSPSIQMKPDMFLYLLKNQDKAGIYRSLELAGIMILYVHSLWIVILNGLWLLPYIQASDK